MNFTSIRERVTVGAIRWAPKGLYSAAIGWGARRVLPRPLRAPVYRAFARRVGADLGEVERPLGDYESLAAFFARRLHANARPLAAGEDTIVAPCDGAVAAMGEVSHGRMMQAKGKDYALRQLVADDVLADRLLGGTYITIYLSPADYHRVHAPVSAGLTGYAHVPGTLFPVNPLFSRSVEQLMASNERVVFYLETAFGPVAVVMVAAVGVSNIELSHERMETRHLGSSSSSLGASSSLGSAAATSSGAPSGSGVGGSNGNRHRERTPWRLRHQHAREIARGDELGAFHLGSTTITIFPPGSVDLGPVQVGDAVRFGQEIGRIVATASQGSGPQ